MTGRYRRQALYVGALCTLAVVWLAIELGRLERLPSPWLALFAVAACLFVFRFGLPHTRVGLLSLERIPQVGLLLVLPPPAAAALCGLASMLWPFLSPSYNQGSLKVATLRGVHNGSMTAVKLLCGGEAFAALGGLHPLTRLNMDAIVPLLGMALTIQIINIASMYVYYRLDGREAGSLLTPFYALMDLVFVPGGVLAALLFNTGAHAALLLFVMLMLVLVLSFNGLAADFSKSRSGESVLLRGARRIDELAEQVLCETRVLLRFDEFYLALVDEDRGEFDIVLNERTGGREPRRRKPLGAGLFGQVVESGDALLIENWDRAPQALRVRADITAKETGAAMFVPLRDGDRTVGLISVQHTLADAFSSADLNLLERLAERAGPALADARAFEELEEYRQRLELRVAERTRELELANREKELLLDALRLRSQHLERESLQDPLTGLANRRHFNQRLSVEIDLAEANLSPLSLVIVDLDRFKEVNDSLGHATGDEVLCATAELMHGHFRADDLLARIGGEEFAVVLPGLTRDQARAACERLRLAAGAFDWRRIHPELRLTLSAGVAQWQPGMDAEALFEAADMRLYRAKRGGRDRVEA